MKGFVRSLPITTKIGFHCNLVPWREIAIIQTQYYDNEAVHSFNTAVVFSSYRKKSIWEEDGNTQTKNMAMKQLSYNTVN